ncbi:MAG: hypothetical protein WCL50_07980 [Spirochaetota bacterium]
MKKALIAALVILALVVTVAGCAKDSKPLVTPAAGAAQSNPHGAVQRVEIPAGAGHKGKVLEALDAGEYSYIQIEESGKKLWVAVMKTKVNKGDEIEFADSPAFTNFQSKILNRTFDSVIFAAGIRNNGKK